MLVTTAAVVCLATNIYHEARGESLEGQYAVAEVTLNRVASPDYPDDICGVVKQGYVDANGNPKRNQCQFSWWCDGRSDKPKDEDAWKKAVAVAGMAIENYESTTYYLVGYDVHHYHSEKVKPRWAKTMKRIAKIGTHIFYRKKNT